MKSCNSFFINMKNIVLSIVMCMSSMWLSCQPKQSFQSVSVDEFEQLIADTSYILLDVRTAAEYAEGHIPCTHSNIDVLQEGFEAKALVAIPKGKSVALYCRSGNRSKKAARLLSEKGYQVVELSTGFKGWAAAGKPLETLDE